MNLMGIDIGGTKTAVCIGNERGDILATQRIPSASDSIEAYGRDLTALCHAVIEKAGLKPDQIDAIGLSAPGALDCKRGILIAPPNNPGWRDVPIGPMVQKSFKAPVFCNNDANACALAEMIFGEHKGAKNLVYLTFSTGMGGGIIANGELIGPGDRKSIQPMAARDGDAFAVAEWDAFMERMAQGMGCLIMALNPDVIILGTIAIYAGDFALKPIREKLSRYAWKWALKDCTISASSLGGKIGDLAALAVAITGLKSGEVR